MIQAERETQRQLRATVTVCASLQVRVLTISFVLCPNITLFHQSWFSNCTVSASQVVHPLNGSKVVVFPHKALVMNNNTVFLKQGFLFSQPQVRFSLVYVVVPSNMFT